MSCTVSLPYLTGITCWQTVSLMEAYSVEDVGEGIQFCVFAYNVQPGIGIDYATGDNWAESNAASQEAAAPIVIETPTQQPQTDTTVQITPEPSVPQESQETTYVLNTNTMKFHYPSCSSVDRMKEKTKRYIPATEKISSIWDICPVSGVILNRQVN